MSGNSPVRVCLVGPSLDILGGQAVQLDRLRKQLATERSLEVDFVPVNPRLPGPLRFLQRVKYVRTVVTSIAYGASLIVRLPRVDVVHAFSASYWSFLLAPLPAMLIGRAFGKRVLLNYRSGEAPDHLAHWPLSRWLMRLAHEIVVPSGYLVGVFGEYGLGARIVVNFVNVENIPHRTRQDLQPVFLSNRNLEPLYNVACTLRAFATIRKRYPSARLIVAGDGRERARLEALVVAEGIGGVEFRGRVAPDQMGALYDEADIYLNSPNIDNMPGSVIEAFAAGLPVVTTRAGGIPFIVDHERTGLLVPLDDAEAMAREALRVLDNPPFAARIAVTAREECLTRYVWPAVSREWQAVYRGDHSPSSIGAARVEVV